MRYEIRIQILDDNELMITSYYHQSQPDVRESFCWNEAVKIASNISNNGYTYVLEKFEHAIHYPANAIKKVEIIKVNEKEI
jgi:flagellar hook assembly protein FlgD